MKRQRHTVSPDTVAEVKKRREGRTMRALARELGFNDNYCATLADVLKEKPGLLTLEGENELRVRLGLSRLFRPMYLAPDERIVKRIPPEKRDKRRCLHASPELYARLKKQMGDLSHEEFLTKLSDLWRWEYGG